MIQVKERDVSGGYLRCMADLGSIQSVALIAAIGMVAFLYSSIGHGGATGYLAAAALLGVAPLVARPGALWMNCCVAGIAFWRFRGAGYFDRRIFCPLALASIPCAWLGSRLHLEGISYAYVLGAALLASGWLLGWGGRRSRDVFHVQPVSWPLAMLVGAGLGLLAGLTGIGGGVFLTPLLILLHWTPAKLAGGISALFILVNSAAGLVGLGHRAMIREPLFFGAVALGIIGAFIGTFYGVKRWQPTTFRRALALVLWIAASKLLLTAD